MLSSSNLAIYSIYLIIVLFLLLDKIASSSTAGSTSGSSTSSLQYLQTESSALAAHHHNVQSFLKNKGIPVGDKPRSLSALSLSRSKSRHESGQRLKVALSTKDNNLQCRVSLGKVPIGSKCVAPCGCGGSSKWITFSELNRLRRKEPSQWRVCQTCQQKFEYADMTKNAGLQASILTANLDSPQLLRSGIIIVTMLCGSIVGVHKWLLRLLASKLLWKMYPKWSRLTHLPFPMLLFGGKLGLQILTERYMAVEQAVQLSLTEVETQLVEPHLSVTEEDAGEEVAGSEGEGEGEGEVDIL